MNAYFELFGSKKRFQSDDPELLTSVENLRKTADVKEITEVFRIKFGKNISYRAFSITPHMDSEYVKNWLSKVKWGYVRYESCAWSDEDSDDCLLVLKSDRSAEDERAFLEGLKAIEYDSGFGTQHLFGTIVFKDNTWLSRGEYDGKEWWESKSCPDEPDWNEYDIETED